MKKNLIAYTLFVLSLVLLNACSNNNTKEKIVQLDTSSKIVTVINIMKPTDIDKSTVLSLLKSGIDETMSKQEGYISSNVHSSIDNNYVINYSQWESIDDLAVASDLVNSGVVPKMVEAFTKGKADFHPFTLVSQFQVDKQKNVTIDSQNKLLTIINILTPNEGISKEEVVNQLNDALENELMTQSGFVSSTVHQSLDNNLVINYTQWKDMNSLQEMVKRVQSGNAPKLAKVFSMATPDFHPFNIVSSHFKQ